MYPPPHTCPEAFTHAYTPNTHLDSRGLRPAPWSLSGRRVPGASHSDPSTVTDQSKTHWHAVGEARGRKRRGGGRIRGSKGIELGVPLSCHGLEGAQQQVTATGAAASRVQPRAFRGQAPEVAEQVSLLFRFSDDWPGPRKVSDSLSSLNTSG